MSELRYIVNGTIVFTKLDLKNVYYQLRVREVEECKTSFCTRYGLIEYTVIPFGWPSTLYLPEHDEWDSPGIPWSRGRVLPRQCFNILKFSGRTWNPCVQGPAVVAGERVGSIIKRISVAVKEVEFSGYMIPDQWVSMSLAKVESELSWQTGRSVRDVQVCIRFANFYRQLIQNFSAVAVA